MNAGSAVLFDIDGTMLFARGVGRRSFSRAFVEVYGIEYPDIDGISFAGATDSGVIRAMCATCGVPNPPAKEEHFFLRLARHLDDAMDELPPEVFPGVPELLAALTEGGVALGLVTGNLRSTAWSKLRHAGLDGYFTFGAYGDETPDRVEITRLALRRLPAGSRCGVLVGDTPNDIEAAHVNGLRAVAVATGWISAEKLAAAGADGVLADFSDTAASLALLRSLCEERTFK
ncbi:MAG: HAD family hydrolase [Kiritimatiellae bacterium]|nr:HAD family hydrolase [Kiritimatiellia bacterium]